MDLEQYTMLSRYMTQKEATKVRSEFLMNGHPEAIVVEDAPPEAGVTEGRITAHERKKREASGG